MLNKIKGKRVLVLGLAKSGRAAVRLLLKAGASSIIANDCKQSDLLQKEMDEFSAYSQVEIVGGGHPQALLEGVSLIIKSRDQSAAAVLIYAHNQTSCLFRD